MCKWIDNSCRLRFEIEIEDTESKIYANMTDEDNMQIWFENLLWILLPIKYLQ